MAYPNNQLEFDPATGKNKIPSHSVAGLRPAQAWQKPGFTVNDFSAINRAVPEAFPMPDTSYLNNPTWHQPLARDVKYPAGDPRISARPTVVQYDATGAPRKHLKGFSPEEINNFNKVVGNGLNRVAGLGGVGPRQPISPRFPPETRGGGSAGRPYVDVEAASTRAEGLGFMKNKPSYVTPSAAVQGPLKPVTPKNPVTGVGNALKGGLAAGFGLYANKDAIADYAGDLGESYGLGAYGPNGSVSQGVSNVGNKIVDDWSGSIAQQAETNRQGKGLGGFISGLGNEAYRSFIAPAVDVGKGAYEFGWDVYNTVTKDYEDAGQPPPILQNGAQAAPTKTETKQPPKTTDTKKPVVTQETPLQASMNDISLARQMGEGDGTGYVAMPGNPGNYRNDTDENNIEGVIYMGNAMPGLAGQTKMQKEGITGYDVNGKPFFNRTDPATYTIQDGQVKKFDQNGKAVGLSAFANSPNSSGIGTNAQGQYVGYGNSADPNAVNPFASDALAKLAANGVSAADQSAAANYLYRDKSNPLNDEIAKAQYLSSTGLGGPERSQFYDENLPDMATKAQGFGLAQRQLDAEMNSPQNGLAQMQLDLLRRANEGDQEALQQYQRLFGKGKDRQPYELVKSKQYNDMGEVTGEDATGYFDPNTGQFTPYDAQQAAVDIPGAPVTFAQYKARQMAIPENANATDEELIAAYRARFAGK